MYILIINCILLEFIGQFNGNHMNDSICDRWLSVEEVAVYLGINRGTLYKWIKRKSIPARKVGYLWKFRKEEVDKWIESGGSDDRRTDKST